MVCDNRKPYWVKMDYVVQSVESKNPLKRNKWHPRLIGLRCGIEDFELRRCGHIWVEGLTEWEECSPYFTTPVVSMEFLNDVLTVETENSVYKFTKIYN